MLARNTKRILMILENGSLPEDTRVYLEAVALHEAGYHVTVICPTGKRTCKYELLDGVHVYRYPRPPELNGFLGYLFEYSYSLIFAFVISLWICLRTGFDVIHVHCPPDLNSMLAIFYQCFGRRFVVDLHDLSPELYQAQKDGKGSPTVVKGLRFFERLASRRADALIATNQTQHFIQIDRCGADPNRCYVVRNGPNELFHSEVAPLDGLLNPGRIVIGYVGLMGFQDGIEYLIRVLARLRDAGLNFLAVLVGRGPALESLKKLTAELGLEEHILFTGFVEFRMVPRYIASFDICVTPDPMNPYNNSCTTIKTMEYMAMERPTVSFRTNENFITAGEAALYADDNNIEEFAGLILKLANDPDLRARMGKIGRQRIDDALSWSHQKTVLIQLYDQLFDPVTPRIPTSELDSKFLFDGRLGRELREMLLEDIRTAHLSRSFRWYYLLRPLIPMWVRQFLQRQRNIVFDNNSDWYYSKPLARALSHIESPIESIWPNQADYALVLTHDVESQAGFAAIPKLAELEASMGFRSSWNLVPYKYDIDLGIVNELRAQGHEIAIHGYNHDGRLFLNKEIFDARVPMINRAIERFEAVGFRAPMVHRNLHWMQQLNIEYDASCFDFDPFQAMPGGVGSIWPFAVGKFIELPYTLPQDQTLFVALGESSDRIWRDKLKFIRHYHGMALMLTHPDYLDSPARLRIYQDFLARLRDQTASWHVLPREMASWFRQQVV